MNGKLTCRTTSYAINLIERSMMASVLLTITAFVRIYGEVFGWLVVGSCVGPLATCNTKDSWKHKQHYFHLCFLAESTMQFVHS